MSDGRSRPFASSFWDVQDHAPPLARDMGRHRQVDPSSGEAPSSPVLKTRPFPFAADPRGTFSSNGSTTVSLADLHLTRGSSYSTVSLEVGAQGASQHKSATGASGVELSSRRRQAIKSAFRRADVRNSGYPSQQEMSMVLQTWSNLSIQDQQRLVSGLTQGGNGQTSYPQFAAYYAILGSGLARDRDFEDLMRHHWGFAEVSDILDDMKNKFAMVGLAYAFRRSLDGAVTSPEMSVESFKEALGSVGMSYTSTDVGRVFDAFEARHGARTLEVLRLTQHLTNAPRPSTPIPGTEADVRQSSEARPSSLTTSQPFDPGLSHSGAFAGTGGAKVGTAAQRLPDPPAAPPEEPPHPQAHDDPHGPMPHAPPEDEHPGGSLAPPELEDTQVAPPEDDNGCMAPPERPQDFDEEVPYAPAESHHGVANYPVSAASSPPAGACGRPMASMAAGAVAPASPLPGRPPAATLPVAAPLSAPASPLGLLVPSPNAGSAATTSQGQGVSKLRVRGRRRAVTVGINYLGQKCELAGCINDSDTFISLLTEDFGYAVEDIRQLRDDHPQRMPTRRNITAALKWLVRGASPGDHLFFHYSGHGTQVKDTDGDEMDGRDEALVPCDYSQSGMLSDDELRRILAVPLARGVRLTCILDCCHSGSAMDLPYKVHLDASGDCTVKKKAGSRMPAKKSEGEIVLLSGCMDSQTSADVGSDAAKKLAGGAMTSAFKAAIGRTPDKTTHKLLMDVRRWLKQNGFEQVPQLSTEQYMNLEEPFLPEASEDYDHPPAPLRPPVRRALTIGINYMTLPAGRGRLSGCINDSETICGILREFFHFTDQNICRLRDDRSNMMPTKANMMASLNWLTNGAAPGDEFFFHYSGHGGQQRDTQGDEEDGKDETLIPCDFKTAGQITDDELHEVLVQKLPKGCRLWVILDCCHSGTALDLPYKVTVDSHSMLSLTKKRPRRAVAPSQAEVIMISGCKDSQTSGDVSGGGAKAAGAMTTAFRHSISADVSCQDLIEKMRLYLKRNQFSQVPQMSSEQFLDLSASFVGYAHAKRGKRALPAFDPSREQFQAPPASPMLPRSPLSDVDQLAMNARISSLQEQIEALKSQGSPSAVRGGAAAAYTGNAYADIRQPVSPMRGVPNAGIV